MTFREAQFNLNWFSVIHLFPFKKYLFNLILASSPGVYKILIAHAVQRVAFQQEFVTQHGDPAFLASAKATLSYILGLEHKHGTYDNALKFWSGSAKK